MIHKLTLISHHLCPFVQRPSIVMDEKGMAFERVNILLDDKPDWFLALSPTGKVPVLKIETEGGESTVLFESMAICEYLEDITPDRPLYATDPLERARERAWIEFLTSLQAAAWNSILPSNPEGSEKRVQFARGLATIEGVLGVGPWFSGERFGMVDAMAAPIFRFFDALDDLADQSPFDGLPRIQAWRAALALRPSVRQAVASHYPDQLRDRLFKSGTR